MAEKGLQKKKKESRREGQKQIESEIVEHAGIIRRAVHTPVSKKIIHGHTSPVLSAGQQNRFVDWIPSGC